MSAPERFHCRHCDEAIRFGTGYSIRGVPYCATCGDGILSSIAQMAFDEGVAVVRKVIRAATEPTR